VVPIRTQSRMPFSIESLHAFQIGVDSADADLWIMPLPCPSEAVLDTATPSCQTVLTVSGRGRDGVHTTEHARHHGRLRGGWLFVARFTMDAGQLAFLAIPSNNKAPLHGGHREPYGQPTIPKRLIYSKSFSVPIR
jgi:hypothetical protein